MGNPIIAGNWKMNGTITESLRLVSDMKDELHRIPRVTKILFPPSVALSSIANLVYASSIELGAQNMHYEVSGAFTGEISAAMVKENCSWVLLGHSERRGLFHESDEDINRKLSAAYANRINPILCVGESLEQRESGQTQEVLRQQLAKATSDLPSINNLTVAYEPVWAIGTGKAATLNVVEETLADLRAFMETEWGNDGRGVPIMYGGSVNEANATAFGQSPYIAGLLVGGASLDAAAFISLTRQFAETKTQAE